jgi:hypothetical protein
MQTFKDDIKNVKWFNRDPYQTLLLKTTEKTIGLPEIFKKKPV